MSSEMEYLFCYCKVHKKHSKIETLLINLKTNAKLVEREKEMQKLFKSKRKQKIIQIWLVEFLFG